MLKKALKSISITNKINKAFVNYKREETFDGFDPANKQHRLMQGINIWTGYYRANPHRFVEEYLEITTLRIFQQILLCAMMFSNFFMFIASRGLGKTYLTALFCCIRCILYPGTKVVIASGKRSQAIEVITKIVNELMPNSPNLKFEIEKYSLNAQDGKIEFKNGSWIRIVTANEGARGARGNILILDEFRLIDEDVNRNVLRKFNTVPRQPSYLANPKYSHLQEPNKEIYLTSAWLKSNWGWKHLLSYFSSMVRGKSYFLCTIPYQMAIKESLLLKSQVESEMQELTFDPVSFSMEMECQWLGSAKDAFFDLEEIDIRRKLSVPIYPKKIGDILGLKQIKKQPSEVRILSIDIALMGGKKNDATAMFVMQLIPNTDNQYVKNIIYAETMEGGHSSLQAIRIKQLYEDYDIDYIVIDGNGNGIAVTDQLQQTQIDQKHNTVYPALNVFNREDMAIRCQVENAPKVIYVVKADATFNSYAAIMLKDSFKRGLINLLYDEHKGRESLYEIKGFKDLAKEYQVMLLDPYVQTTLLIREMIQLEYTNEKGQIKVYEKSTNRKDRYTSLAYANYFANELEIELRTKNEEEIDWINAIGCVTSVKF